MIHTATDETVAFVLNVTEARAVLNMLQGVRPRGDEQRRAVSEQRRAVSEFSDTLEAFVYRERGEGS